ncbi:growth/differentiation factor 2-like [Microplitis demolitor]|uniref:growth/differentiation factor 2-like n=1 Tax=Microplitis demolitor TaxID=69319 RepID=UPI0004CCCDF3|nr:growth/differentiation factor 2-like [Microplitis demolitor]
MGSVVQCWFITFSGILGLFFLWRTSPVNWTSSNIVTKTSIQVDVSLPSSIINQHQNLSSQTLRYHKKKYRGSVSKYMLKLYHRRPSADIVRALQPLHVSAPINSYHHNGGGRILEFRLPPANPEENLEAAELLGSAGMILRVMMLNNLIEDDKFRDSRKEETWRAFNVTEAVKMTSGGSLRFLVRGRIYGNNLIQNDSPILVLSYTKPKSRKRRSVDEETDDTPSVIWTDNRRRRRNPCRKRPLYVDFAAINYDEWIVAPPGYDAYQCVGRCLFPFGDHLSPTKHAIVQALVSGALQGADGTKPVGRVCCVPTRLAPTSLLYLDASGTLTYQYGYEDMVVVECGCR